MGLHFAGTAPDMGYFESGMVDVNCPANYLTTGENWISVPVSAFNDGPYSVFSDLGTWPNTIYHNLYRYNTAAANTIKYPTYQSDAVQFGKIIPGQAYKLLLNANQSTIFVEGIELKNSQNLTINGTGTRDFYFGNPFNKTIYKTYCKISYNGSDVSLQQAITNGWIGNLQHFNPVSKTLEAMGFALEKWHAYKLTAYNTSGELKLVFNYSFPGDLDSDGDVDWNDLDTLSGNWLVTDLEISPTGDLDGDKDVDFKDYAVLANNWMTGP